jgi:hypothetical protein
VEHKNKNYYDIMDDHNTSSGVVLGIVLLLLLAIALFYTGSVGVGGPETQIPGVEATAENNS